MRVRTIARIAFDPIVDRASIIEHGLSRLTADALDRETVAEREDDRSDDGKIRFIARGLLGDRPHANVPLGELAETGKI